MTRDPRPPSPWAPRPPTPAGVDAQFELALSDSTRRGDVDRWSAQWMAAEGDPGIEDDAVWWALTKLLGIDERHGRDAPHLHSDEQITEWRREFRTRAGLDS